MDINTQLGTPGIVQGFATPFRSEVANDLHLVRGLQHVRLAITNLNIPVTTALIYGSAKLMTFPRRNLVLMGASARLTALKGNIATGIVAATSVSFGLGTAAASNATLATTMVNVVPITTYATSALLAQFYADRFAAIAATTPLSINVAAANILYLNCACGATTVDDSMTFNGAVDLYYFDLGNHNNL